MSEERMGMLYSMFIIRHPQGFPLTVMLRGRPHVLLSETIEEAENAALTLNVEGCTILPCKEHSGNWLFRRALEAGNDFAIIKGNGVHPIESMGLFEEVQP